MKASIVTIFLLLFLTSLSAQETAEVYVLRKTGYSGSAVGFNLIMDGELLCKARNKRYSIHQVPAGDHSFQARIFGKKKMKKKSMEPLDLTFEAGETYYLQLNLKTRAFDSQVDVQEIAKSSADRIMPDLKLQENCKAE